MRNAAVRARIASATAADSTRNLCISVYLGDTVPARAGQAPKEEDAFFRALSAHQRVSQGRARDLVLSGTARRDLSARAEDVGKLKRRGV